mgnify:CR=1 FL=1
MSLTEKLLALDAAKYKEKKTDTIEIKRLSKLTGEPFIVKIQEVDDNRMQELQAMLLTPKGKGKQNPCPFCAYSFVLMSRREKYPVCLSAFIAAYEAKRSFL